MNKWIATAAAVLLAAAPAQADSANVEITANVPSQCEVHIVDFDIVTTNPLFIAVSVQRVCNATHELSVTYEPAVLTAPETFVVSFDGMSPSTSGPGAATFANLPHTNSIEELDISYVGPAAERSQIAHTVVISIAAP